MELPELTANDLSLITDLSDAGFKVLALGCFKVLVGAKEEEAVVGALPPHCPPTCITYQLYSGLTCPACFCGRRRRALRQQPRRAEACIRRPDRCRAGGHASRPRRGRVCVSLGQALAPHRGSSLTGNGVVVVDQRFNRRQRCGVGEGCSGRARLRKVP